MRKFYKSLLTAVLGVAAFAPAHAQIDGVSFTLSPSVSYHWWNDHIALENTPFYGLRAGIGFGPYVELRGTFEKSFNLKNTLQDQRWNPFSQETLDKLDGMDMDVTRFGGELKFNVLNSSKFVSPYLTLGGGVQVFNYNPFDKEAGTFSSIKEKQKDLYVAAGLGLRFNLSDRVGLSLEGKNIRFYMDDHSYLTKAQIDEKKKRLGNWAALASLDFALGGTKRQHAQANAYRRLYSDGFKGMKFVLEPGMLYADFHEKLGRKDQWFLGGAAGVDFSSLVGLRAFYYQATEEPGTLNFKFNNDLKMYGANLLLRLNQPRGIVPYLTIGAGYLDQDNLLPTNPTTSIDGTTADERFDTHNLFLQGGAGIEIPLSKHLALFGTVNALVMSNDEKIEATEVDNVYTSIAYNAGLRVNFGKAAKAPSYAVEEMELTNEKVNQLRHEAEAMGYVLEPTDEVTVLADTALILSDEVEAAPLVPAARTPKAQMMTKKEFEDMVNRILLRIRTEEMQRKSQISDQDLQLILSSLNGNAVSTTTTAAGTEVVNQALVNQIRSLEARLHSVESAQSAAALLPAQTLAPAAPVVSAAVPVAPVAPVAVRTRSFRINRLAPMTGVSFGEGTQWVVGARAFMPISNTNLEFVPEAMVGIGDKGSFDLSGNVVYNLPLKHSRFVPYAGLGLGIYAHGDGLKFGPNILIGTQLRLNRGALILDYTSRGFFKNNQIAVGYQFGF